MTGMLLRLLGEAILATVMALAAAAAHADGAPLATYQGADRLQRIAEAAKGEGELTIYTSTPVEDMKVLTDAFERKYGIKTKVWRASSEKVLQRAVAEARAQRFDVDAFDTNGPQLEALVREKLLTPVTKLVRKTELPASYDGFADPKWKGRLGIEAEDSDWFATISTLMGEAKAETLFRSIVAANGVSVRKGHTLLTQLVASGEVPVALTVYNYKAEQLKNQGAPIDWYVIPPAIARANGVGVAARAPHPNAALLWYEFELGDEGQRLLLTRDFVPTNRTIDTPLNRFPLRFVDAKAVVDDSGKWDRRYADIFGGQAR